MTVMLPGLTRIVVWDEPNKVLPRDDMAQEEAVKWHGNAFPDATPPRVEIHKRCSIYPYTEVTITVKLDEEIIDGQKVQGNIAIDMGMTARFTLLEASDFSICMIEAIRVLKANEAHKRGEVHGLDSNGGIRYE